MKRKFDMVATLTVCAIFFTLFSGCSNDENKVPGRQRSAEGPSLYEMQDVWQDQSGKPLKLESLKGKIPVISMIFTRCPFACPRTISDLKSIEKQIPEDHRKDVRFVLVSFDDVNDTPAQLRVFSKKMGTGKDWILLHGNEHSIRDLAMSLGVKYTKQAGGMFAHSNIITLLDRSGAVNTQLEGLGSDPSPVLSAIREL